MRKLILIAFTVITITRCNSPQYEEAFASACEQQILEQTIVNEDLEYSISLPSDYVVQRDYDVLSISSVKRTDKENYIESCGLTVESNTMNFKLDEFYKNAVHWDEEGYSEEYDNFTIVDQGNIILNDVDFIWNTYQYGDEQTLNMFSIMNGKTYRLIFLSYINDFDSVFCNYVNIAKTFKLGVNLEDSL